MPQVTFLPVNKTVEAKVGETLLDVAIAHHVPIQHACGGFCACTTCHVIVREGFKSLNEMEEKEEDLLDKAWGLEPFSRLSCQAMVGETDLVVEIPKYSINMAKEGHR
mgnify:CR=1 FL=1